MRRPLVFPLVFPLLFLLAFAPDAPAQIFSDADAGDEYMEDMEEDAGDGGYDFVSDQDLDNYETYSERGREVDDEAAQFERVKAFDVAGVMLGYDYPKAREVLRERRYRLSDVEYKIPEYFAFNYDSICREKNMLVPSMLKSCVEGLARKDKMRYVARVRYVRADTDERVDVYFTSPLTSNKVWKVVYENDVDKKMGDAQNFQYQRDERRRAFWYSVTLKYGEPNVEPNRWLLDPNAEMPVGLTAEFGRITLENPQQNAFDITESHREARLQFKYKEYSF
jgi:hypothetical protein